MFCPLVSLSSNFGLLSDYYNMETINSLKETFFHMMQALIFPNAIPFQISSILCYAISIIFVITLFFGIDDTNKNQFLPIKMSTADIESFYPTKIKNNYYNIIDYLLFILFILISLIYSLM